MLRHSANMAVSIYGVVCLFGAIASMLLPIETKGREMKVSWLIFVSSDKRNEVKETVYYLKWSPGVAGHISVNTVCIFCVKNLIPSIGVKGQNCVKVPYSSSICYVPV